MKKNEKLRDQLLYAANFYNQDQLAEKLNRTTRTIRDWKKGRSGIPAEMELPLRQLLHSDRPDPLNGQKQMFRFIDLFAGIGGIRRGFEKHGGECVYTSEWDRFAAQTYLANFPNDEHDIRGDITQEKMSNIPSHDVLLAGFPCQPFSLAGVSKKNSLGRKHGFEDETQGTLFHDVAKIIAEKQPTAFLLENVKNLKSHDKGRTWEIIRHTLEDILDYKIFPLIIDGRSWVPQHRERIYIVGFKDHEVGFSWDDLRTPDIAPTLGEILHPEDGSEEPEPPFTEGKKAKVSDRYTLSDKLWNYLQAYKEKHQAAGNGFGFGLVGPDDVARTLSARYHKDGSEILVSQGRKKNPRRLTPRECARLMGFDNTERKIKIQVSDTQAYRQFGNSVVVPVIEEIARIMVPHIVGKLRRDEFEEKQLKIPLRAV